MTTARTHDWVLSRLSEHLDGDLRPAEAEVVRRHLDECATCREAAYLLRAAVQEARSLDRPEPPPGLWPAIAGELQRGERVLLGWRPFMGGALAGAAAVVLTLVLGGLVRWPASQPSTPGGAAPQAAYSGEEMPAGDPFVAEAEAEFRRAGDAYERSIDKLRSLAAREEARWSDDARANHIDRLRRLDEAIARSREAARRTPGDGAGNEILFAAYQKKLDFLAAAVHRGGPAGPSPGVR